MLAIVAGVVCGVLEYLMLTRLSRALLGGKAGEACVWLAVKAGLLAAALALVYILDYSHILWAGAGVGLTMATLAMTVSLLKRITGFDRRKADI